MVVSKVRVPRWGQRWGRKFSPAPLECNQGTNKGLSLRAIADRVATSHCKVNLIAKSNRVRDIDASTTPRIAPFLQLP